MSYPYGPEVHAERPPSLRYGRTTLRLPAPPARPRLTTLRTRDATQRNPHVHPAVALGMFGAPRPAPLPRRPLDASCRVRRWYENELGWPTVPGDPLRLVVGVRYDVLDVPAEAGQAALRRLPPGSPVAVLGDRMRFLVAAGTAEELPGLLEWLEWGTLPLGLTALGTGSTMRAPRPPGMDTPPRAREGGEGLSRGVGGGLLPPGADARCCRMAGGPGPGEGGGVPCVADAPFLRGAGGSGPGEGGGLLPCETGSPIWCEAGGSGRRKAGGLWPDEAGGTLPCGRDAPCLGEAGGSVPRGSGGTLSCETDLLLPRRASGLRPDEANGPLPCGRDAPCLGEAGGSGWRKAGGLWPDEAGGTLSCGTDASRLREAGGSVPGEASGLRPDEADGLLPCGRDASCLREAGGSGSGEMGGRTLPCETDSLLPRQAGGSVGRALPCGTGASGLRAAGGSVVREEGGLLMADGFMTSGPVQGFAPSAWGADGALSPEPGLCRGRPLPLGRLGSQGAAVWLRPPEPGCEVEASLPTLSALGGGGDAPDLVRLVNTVATQCLRVLLRRTRAQPPALRAQGRQ
ncbi:SCO3374 family protein [Streptomyces sp. NPDC007991]|uniref:SCO3374 family protein n=1 Tax=Streptomyces sp. NPDC007991 TaxID=3364803 RepID=UPI0036F082D9